MVSILLNVTKIGSRAVSVKFGAQKNAITVKISIQHQSRDLQ